MIHYITSWSRQPEKHSLCQFPAASTKSEYVAECLKRISPDEKLRVLSIAQTTHKKWYWAPRSVIEFDEVETDETIPSIGSPLRFIRALNVLILNVYLIIYLLFRVHKNDTVIVYHSCSYATAEILAYKLKRLPIILEVEEIYQDVNAMSERMKRAERNVFKCAAAYIFSSVLLNNEINADRKPIAISHGTYKVEDDRKFKFNDGKIHVVYAGTLNPKKGGAMAAAGLACLPSNYRVHILGQGTTQLIQQIQVRAECSTKIDGAEVTYDGFYSGEDYIRFIQACDIGLSTQNPEAAFNATSFPSKVLSYMANGLRVVSARIEAVESSAVGDMITYYEKQTPECIAEAVMSIDMSQPYDSRKRIAELDEQFQKDLKQLIEAK